MVGSELASEAVTLSLNEGRTDTTTRQESGPKIDRIIRSIADHAVEIGVVESSALYQGRTATKWLKDSAKVRRTLSLMAVQLHNLADGDEELIRRIQLVGVITAGSHLQMIRCARYKKGGAMYFLDDEEVFKFPRSLIKSTVTCGPC